MNYNKAIVIGNVTKDPELKALPSGQSVCSFSLATNRSWKDAQGNKQEEVEFHNLVAFGKQADIIKQYVIKGSQLMVEGRLKTRNWDKDGVRHNKTEIIVENFQFGAKSQAGASMDRAIEAEAPQKDSKADLDTAEYPDEEINLEDIPF